MSSQLLSPRAAQVDAQTRWRSPSARRRHSEPELSRGSNPRKSSWVPRSFDDVRRTPRIGLHRSAPTAPRRCSGELVEVESDIDQRPRLVRKYVVLTVAFHCIRQLWKHRDLVPCELHNDQIRVSLLH